MRELIQHDVVSVPVPDASLGGRNSPSETSGTETKHDGCRFQEIMAILDELLQKWPK